LIRALGVLCEQPGHVSDGIASLLGLGPPDPVDHTELFVHQLPPYASIYLGSQGKIGGDARERIAGFWRALGMTPPVEPDHLAALLGLWATLIDVASDQTEPARRLLVDHSLVALIWEHLASWLYPYLARVADIAVEPYPSWAAMLQTLITRAPGPEPADRALPRHFDTEPEPGSDDLVDLVLTPVKSGIILTRADLKRAATDLGLGLRIGERVFALRSLLDQDHQPVVEWLAREARRQAGTLDGMPGPNVLTSHWASRARITASSLEGLLAERQPANLPWI
jgi:hypothetical protein